MKSLILLLSLLFSLNAVSQIELDITNKTLKELLAKEAAAGGKLIPTTSRYISASDEVAQPVRFQRKEQVIPDLIVEYFYFEVDSLMNEVLYEWDISNFNDSQNNPQSKEVQFAMIAKYKKLVQMLTAKYGAGNSTGSLEDLSDIESSSGLRRKDVWQPNTATKITMYITLSNFYKKSGIVTMSPTHRIRLYVTNLNR